jgi:hypothetical protein
MIRKRRTKLPIMAVAVMLTVPTSFASTKTPDSNTAHSKLPGTTSSKTSHHVHRRSLRRPRGQKAIDNQRARQIQEALVRQHYLAGQTSGTWDAATQAAMRRYQADQGWQTKIVPDSRALIRLGLGPDHEHLLNPDSAMTSEPQTRAAADPQPAAGRTAPVSVSNTGIPGPVPGQASSPASAPPELTPSR